jgi:FkbM family methyltransferase
MFFNELGEQINTAAFEAQEQEFASKYVEADDVVLELGARYGTVTVRIQSKLNAKQLHVAVEPDPLVLEVLRKNLERHDSLATVFHGIVSKTPGALEQDGYATIVRLQSTEDEKCCASINVEDLETRLGAKFTALVADCEGCLGPFFKDFPEFLAQLRMVMLETDPGYNQTDYAEIRALLLEKGFVEADHVGWQYVYVRESSSKPSSTVVDQ